MPQRIVHLLEMIQIDKQQPNDRSVTACPLDGLIQAVPGENAVGQTGKRVIIGLTYELSLRNLCAA